VEVPESGFGCQRVCSGGVTATFSPLPFNSTELFVAEFMMPKYPLIEL